MRDLSLLKEKLEEELAAYAIKYQEWVDNGSLYRPPKKNKIKALEAEIAFHEYNVRYERVRVGIYLLNGWMYYSPSTGKWRVKRSSPRWTKSRYKVNNFITHHVLY